MKRLIRAGLMFGNLIPVNSPVLVARYRRALQHLIGKTTALDEFHVDLSGFSPEIADELGDALYLNPGGCNRLFILLTTAQRTAPLLGAKFSMSRGVLRQFIEANLDALFALTAREAVTGEVLNSVYDISRPARVLDVRTLRIEADTVGDTLEQARRLEQMITRFRTEPDAWQDDVLIARMIGAAGETGDILRHPVRLEEMSFRQDSFWTSHFGGLYVFRDVDEEAVICAAGKESIGPLPVPQVLELGEATAIARFLERNGLVEPIIAARGVDAAGILRQKMDFIALDSAQAAGLELHGAQRRDLRAMIRRHGAQMPPEFHSLARLLAWAEAGGAWPQITSEDPAYFYTLRAAQTPNRDLVNMLLSELAPKDVRQVFICHKDLFYRLYSGWTDTRKTYVVEFLQREYQIDKAGAREALFGSSDPEMGEEPSPPQDDLIARVGPWGALAQVGPWGAIRRR